MRSKFSYTAYFLMLFVLVVLSGLIAYVIFVFRTSEPPYLDGVPLTLLLASIFTWLFSGEFRAKIIKTQIEDKYVIIRRYGGLASPRTILYADIDGFNTSILSANTGDYEYLYLMQDGKKIAKISDFYHQNYYEMKAMLKYKLKDLGPVEFSYRQEMREIFI